jgi:hypothetical protein
VNVSRTRIRLLSAFAATAAIVAGACGKDSSSNPSDVGSGDSGRAEDAGSSGQDGSGGDGTATDLGPGDGPALGDGGGRDGGEEDGAPDVGPVVGGEYIWGKGYGTTDMMNVPANAVATDGEGNVIVAGNLFGTASFGGSALMTAGESDIFVAKLALADGAHIWSRRYGSAGSIESASDIAVDGQGDIVITGFVTGADVDFGGGSLPSSGGLDPFVLKVSGMDGAHVWSIRLIGADVETANSIAVDSDGNAIIAGTMSGSGLDLGGMTVTSSGGTDLFVAKYAAASGMLMWGVGKGSSGSELATGVATDANGDVIVTGAFGGTIDFGGGPLMTPNSSAFVAKLASRDGAYLWAHGYGSQSGTTGAAVATDSARNVVVAGAFLGVIDFGGGHRLDAVGFTDIFIARFAADDGATLDAARFGGAHAETVKDLAIDRASGDVVLAGTHAQVFDFGGGPLPSVGGDDVYLARLSSSFAYRWARTFGSMGTDHAGAIAIVGSDGSIAAAGAYGGPMDVGGGPLPFTAMNGLQNAFAMRRRP